jgi:hypothetical protein
MCPHPKLVSQYANLINGATYKISFKPLITSYTVKNIKVFLSEIAQYAKYPDPCAPEIELLLPNGTYFGQVSTITRDSQEEVVPHGYGKIVTDDYTYSGLWFYGHMEGEGETIFVDGRIYKGNHTSDGITEGIEMSLRDEYVYTGSFYNWVKHGKGKEVFPDGSVAEGDYAEDDFTKGTLIWANGKVEIGDFYVDDERDYHLVKGTVTTPDGKIILIE